MGITSKTRKMLWGKSGNRCAMPDCKKELVVNISEINNHSIIGEECHIIAQSPDGPRGNKNFDINKIDDYDNLILMCGDHHTIIDDKSNLALFTVEKLQNMKKEHENWVFSKFTFEDKKKLDDDLFYSEYIDNWTKFIYLNHWKEWTYYLLNTDSPSLYLEVNNSLELLNEYNFTRFWPQRYIELENSFFNFDLILKDFITQFHRHSIHLHSYYNTEKFHKKEWHEDQRVFNKLYEEYQFHVLLVQDLVLELTRAVNYICDLIRRDIDPRFRIQEGKVIVQTRDFLDENIQLCAQILYPTYGFKQLYRGLKNFKMDRIIRDFYFGIGNSPKDETHLRKIYKHNYAFIQ
ncbi:HNH endonuclease [Aliarcobacter vitoriensis]|uniref:HNH endonuclease n=1 Tax=Aliarcobacter vitoriensis TaxID=2011099 RepID=UPI003AB0CCC1